MADAKVSALSALTPSAASFSDLAYIAHVADNTPKKMTLGDLQQFLRAAVINTYTDADKTVVAGDLWNVMNMSSSADHVVTLPQDSDLTVPIGTCVEIDRDGTGAVTISAGTGATLQYASPTSAGTCTIPTRYAAVLARKKAANTWRVYGAA